MITKNPKLQIMAVKASNSNTEAFWLTWRKGNLKYSRRYTDWAELNLSLGAMDSDFINWEYGGASMELRPGYLTAGAPNMPNTDTITRIFHFHRTQPLNGSIGLVTTLVVVMDNGQPKKYAIDPDTGSNVFLNAYLDL
jgi:hypothetical protein